MRVRACLAAVALLIFATSTPAQQVFPNKPIRVINGFAPGGTFDYIARLWGQKLAETAGWKFVVDSKTGADGRIGTQECAKAPPDGYTLCIGGSSTHAIHASVFRTLPYDVSRDFVPVALIGITANILAVNPSLPVKNVQELIALAKNEPGKLAFASAGTGTSTHLAGEMFKDLAGVDILHVPFRGGAPAITAVIGNQVPILSDNVSTVAPYVVSGKLRGLAVTSLKRQPNVPDVPTMDESGLRGFDVGLWYAFFAPAATPREIVQRLNAEMNRVLAMPEIREQLEKRGIEPRPMTPAEAATFVKSGIERYGAIARKVGIVLE
jgi:tripartite-type tricarboxylate transporter receptor subunit TctC